MEQEPVFIVGVQRSGTTLLAAMLAAHSRLSCGPETHFFRRLAQVDAARLCDPRTWPSPATEFIWSITHTGVEPGTRKSLIDRYRLARESIPGHLQSRAPSIPNILASVTEPYMTAKGKVRWVEKTPDHLLHVATIRHHFPKSPIIHIVRDPRDVALSLTNVPWGSRSLLEGLLYWERLEGTSREFLSTDLLCHTLRFEDLIASPVGELRRVCEFIGEEFEAGMLDTSKTGTEINSRNAPWKDKVSQRVDVGRVGVWRAALTREQNRLAEAVLGNRLDALGYPREEEFCRVGEIRPELGVAAGYADALNALATRGVRFWKVTPDERTRARIYLGQPRTADRLGRHRLGRALNALAVLTDIGRAAVSDRDLYWVPDRDDHQWAGYVSFVVKKCLGPFRLDAGSLGPSGA